MAVFGQKRFEELAGQRDEYLPIPCAGKTSIKTKVEEWIDLQAGRIDKPKGITSSTHELYARAARWFASEFGEERDVGQVSFDSLKAIHGRLQRADCSGAQRVFRWMVIKQLCDNWEGQGLVTTPAILRMRAYAFGAEKTKADRWTPEIYRQDWQKADNLGKLILCAAAN